jgi:hypothetical protein
MLIYLRETNQVADRLTKFSILRYIFYSLILVLDPGSSQSNWRPCSKIESGALIKNTEKKRKN